MSVVRSRSFDMLPANEVADDATVGFFGPRGCGKTTAMTTLMSQKSLLRGMAMCPTPESFVTYGKFIPLSYVFDYFATDTLDHLMKFQNAARFRIETQFNAECAKMEYEAQKQRPIRWQARVQRLLNASVKKGWKPRMMQLAWEREIQREEEEWARLEVEREKQAAKRLQELRAPYSCFLIMDDLGSNKTVMKSEMLKTLINNGRHYMLLLFIAIQYAIDFPKGCRGGLDWVFVFREPSRPNMETLYKSFVGTFPTLDSFINAVEDAHRRGCILAIRKTKQRQSIYENVYLFKSDPNLAKRKGGRFFGNEAYEYVHEMMFDEAKFQEHIGGSSSASGSSKSKSITTKRKLSKKASAAAASLRDIGARDDDDDDNPPPPRVTKPKRAARGRPTRVEAGENEDTMRADGDAHEIQESNPRQTAARSARSRTRKSVASARGEFDGSAEFDGGADAAVAASSSPADEFDGGRARSSPRPRARGRSKSRAAGRDDDAAAAAPAAVDLHGGGDDDEEPEEEDEATAARRRTEEAQRAMLKQNVASLRARLRDAAARTAQPRAPPLVSATA